MTIITDITASIAAVASVIGVYLGLKTFIPDFSYERVQTNLTEPIISRTAILISRPTPKPIAKCKVIYNGKALLCNPKNPRIDWFNVELGGSGQFYIPKGMENEKAKITIKDGWLPLKSIRFWQITEKS